MLDFARPLDFFAPARLDLPGVTASTARFATGTAAWAVLATTSLRGLPGGRSA